MANVGDVETIKESGPDIDLEQFGELMVLLCDELTRKALTSLEHDREAGAAVALIGGTFLFLYLLKMEISEAMG